MDDYVRVLEAEQGNSNGLLLQVLVSGYDEWDYLIAVEGVDDKKFYYDLVIRALPDKSVEFIECGGKPSLLKFKDAVQDYPWVDPPFFRYFCDKDFDDYLGLRHDDVWYTDRYSIESYLVGRDYIAYNISKFSTRPLSTGEKNALLDKYEQNFDAMVRNVRAFAAFMCQVRGSGEHPMFDDFGIDRLFELREADMPSKANRMEDAVKILKIRTVVSLSSLLERARQFTIEDHPRWLRGKLALQIARKSYDLARRYSPMAVRQALPPPTFLSSEAFGQVSLHCKEIAELAVYCQEG